MDLVNNLQNVKTILLKGFVQDILIPLVLVFLLVILSNPFGFSVSPPLIGVILVFLLLFFAGSTFFYLKEGTVKDQKEFRNVNFSDKVALYSVTTVLLAGVTVQSLLHVLDVWLALALAALVAGKVWGRIYLKAKEEKNS